MHIAIIALFLVTFSIGTIEFVVSGILPEIAADLGVSIPSAGYTGSAVGSLIGARRSDGSTAHTAGPSRDAVGHRPGNLATTVSLR